MELSEETTYKMLRELQRRMIVHFCNKGYSGSYKQIAGVLNSVEPFVLDEMVQSKEE